jgi:hypothetical protein
MSALEYLPTIIKVAEQTRHRQLIALRGLNSSKPQRQETAHWRHTSNIRYGFLSVLPNL